MRIAARGSLILSFFYEPTTGAVWLEEVASGDRCGTNIVCDELGPIGSSGPRWVARLRCLRVQVGAIAFLLLASLVVYAPLLHPGVAPYSPYSDILAAHLGIKQALYASLSAGHGLPLWRDDQFAGVAALTQPQAQYLHPLQLLFYLLRPEAAFGPSMVVSFCAGALGAFLLARVLGHGTGVALLCGVAQLVCFKLVIAGYAGWSSVLPTLVALPYLCAAWIAVCARPSRATVLALALCLIAILLGGTPQTAYYMLCCLSGWPVVRVLRATPGTRVRRALATAAALGGAFALALACTALLWLPLFSEWRWLARAAHGYDFFLSGHGLTPRHLSTLLYPEWLGTPLQRSYPGHELWEDVAYFGLVPLCALAFALLRVRALGAAERYLVVAWGVSVVASLESPLLRALYSVVPGYAAFRLPGRMLFVTAVLGIALGGSGLRLAGEALERRTSRAVVRLLAVVLSVCMLVEGAWYAHAYLRTRPSSELLPAASHPLRSFTPRRDERAAVLGRGSFNYGWAASLGWSLVNGYDPYNYAPYKRYMALAETGQALGSHPGNWVDLKRVARPDLLDELAVGTLITSEPIQIVGFEPAGYWPAVRNFTLYRGLRDKPLYLYRKPSVRSRARFASEVERLPTEHAVELRLEAQPLHGQAYLVARDGAAEVPSAAPDPAARVEVVEARAGFSVVRTRSAAPQLLVLAEGFHPGWRAQVDGRPVEVEQTNLALLGVVVPAGQHEVTLRFVPLRFELGAGLSAAGLCAMLLLALSCLRSARTPRPRRPDTTAASEGWSSNSG